MIILTVNSGSTSIKLAAFETDTDTAPAPGLRRLAAVRHAGAHIEPEAELRDFLNRLATPPQAVVHRVVHGGVRFKQPTLIDEGVREAIAHLSELAPLHNPLALRWLDAARRLCGRDVAHIAAFDTAFFACLPAVAGEYALPAQLGVDLGVRRYGFHGLAHEAMWRRFCEVESHLEKGGRLITIQLGGGCSMSALDQGRPQDTSMGFSPLEGLVMATRSGDIDPAAVPYVSSRLGLHATEVIERLNREAGLAGLSGLTGEEASPAKLLASSSQRARFAVELYCYRARKYLGAFLAVLGGCDGIVFGGGVGEHVPAVRERILCGMGWAGIELDSRANEAALGTEARISAAGGAVALWVVEVHEEPLMVRQALSVLGGGARR